MDKKNKYVTLDELTESQNVMPIKDVEKLFGTWPGEKNDGFEDAIDNLRHQKKDTIVSELAAKICALHFDVFKIRVLTRKVDDAELKKTVDDAMWKLENLIQENNIYLEEK